MMMVRGGRVMTDGACSDHTARYCVGFIVDHHVGISGKLSNTILGYIGSLIYPIYQRPLQQSVISFFMDHSDHCEIEIVYCGPFIGDQNFQTQYSDILDL